MRLLTGMDRNTPEWASITGADSKIHPKIHVLTVNFDKKFQLSHVNYQMFSMSRQFQCKNYFLTYPPILVPYKGLLTPVAFNISNKDHCIALS